MSSVSKSLVIGNYAKFVSPVARFAFPSVFKFAVFKNKPTDKYEITILLPKLVDGKPNPDVIEMQRAADVLLREKFPTGAPKSVSHTWLIDGDKKDYEGYENHWAIKAKTNRRPTVIDKNKQAIFPPTADDLGSGDYAKLQTGGHYGRLSMGFWFSNHETGGKQVLMNLFGVQLIRDGVPFTAQTEDATDDFDAFGDDDSEDF